MVTTKKVDGAVAKPKRNFVSTRDFVLTWHEHGGDPEKVAEVLGIKAMTARMRADRLRKGDPEKDIPAFDFMLPTVLKPRGRHRTAAEAKAEYKELKALLRERK